MKTAILVCSPLKKSTRIEEWYGNDIYHLASGNKKSYCNRDIEQWSVIGPEQESVAISSNHCCKICADKYRKEYGL